MTRPRAGFPTRRLALTGLAASAALGAAGCSSATEVTASEASAAGSSTTPTAVSAAPLTPTPTPSPTPSDTDRASSLPPRDPLTPIQPTARPGLSELDAIIDRLFRDPSFLAVLARLDRPKPCP